MTPQPIASSPHAPLWRVGRAPEPWTWAEWAYAGDQRWDDADHQFRTVYAANTPYGCFVEILAHFRPDPALQSDLADIVIDQNDADIFPSTPPGAVPYDWVDHRRLSSADTAGNYCDVTTADTIAALRPHFLDLIADFPLPDFDAAAIKTATPRELTQRIASWLYKTEARPGQLWDGVSFASRHGDELRMWAIFERPGDHPHSALISIRTDNPILHAHPDLQAALDLHHLHWIALA